MLRLCRRGSRRGDWTLRCQDSKREGGYFATELSRERLLHIGEVRCRVASPRSPPLGEAPQGVRAGRPRRTLKGSVGRGEGIRPVQRTAHDCRGGSRSQAWNSCQRPQGRGRSAPGSRRTIPSITMRAIAASDSARHRGTPSCWREWLPALATRSAVSPRWSSPQTPVSSGSPRWLLTEPRRTTPSSWRAAISKPSNAPGSLSPGLRRTSAVSPASEVALAHAQLVGQVTHAATVERTRGDPHCGLRDARHRVTHGAARCQFRPASKAWPKAIPLGRRRGIEELSPFRVGHSRGADRPAVHPGRADADEEEPVESRVPCDDGAATSLVIEHGSYQLI
jgi:hypothetical protein